jgi:pteridine reductase
MSKAALVELVRSLAVELARPAQSQGHPDAGGNARPPIRVNAVAPGVVAFPDAGYESDAEAQRAYLERVPLGRSGTPEDAARAVAFLAFDADYCTGQILRVDGGRWLA